MEYWSVGAFHYSSTPGMSNGKSDSLDTKTQFMDVYGIV